jgi:hypothetical protein
MTMMGLSEVIIKNIPPPFHPSHEGRERERTFHPSHEGRESERTFHPSREGRGKKAPLP